MHGSNKDQKVQIQDLSQYKWNCKNKNRWQRKIQSEDPAKVLGIWGEVEKEV